MKRIVAYYRVSTAQQGESGLGLEAQQSLVASYTASNGGELVAEVVEVESGANDDRPQLAEAMKLCRRQKATLVIGTLDRLARDVHFVAGLMKSDVPFVCADAPTATAFELHIRAAMAEEERRKIAERTKRALAAYKNRGGVLGAHRDAAKPLTQSARQKGAEVAKTRSARFYGDVAPLIREQRANGKTLGEIATRLNTEGRTTQAGMAWTATAVHRVLKRL